jgi:hypothetical protein
MRERSVCESLANACACFEEREINKRERKKEGVCYCVGVNLFEKYKKLREREKKYKLS